MTCQQPDLTIKRLCTIATTLGLGISLPFFSVERAQGANLQEFEAPLQGFSSTVVTPFQHSISTAIAVPILSQSPRQVASVEIVRMHCLPPAEKEQVVDMQKSSKPPTSTNFAFTNPAMSLAFEQYIQSVASSGIKWDFALQE